MYSSIRHCCDITFRRVPPERATYTKLMKPLKNHISWLDYPNLTKLLLNIRFLKSSSIHPICINAWQETGNGDNPESRQIRNIHVHVHVGLHVGNNSSTNVNIQYSYSFSFLSLFLTISFHIHFIFYALFELCTGTICIVQKLIVF